MLKHVEIVEVGPRDGLQSEPGNLPTAAKIELIKLDGSQELEGLQARLSAILAEAQSPDPWTSRARPSFL